MARRLFRCCTGFNPRPCARGDHHGRIPPVVSIVFQSTPLCEGRREHYRDAGQRGEFQSTPLCEGRHRSASSFRGLVVSIHAPVRGATQGCPQRSSASGFNPRPCARGDSGPAPRPRRSCVSIHAPVRGATTLRMPCSLVTESVSIHAPVRGATAGHDPTCAPVGVSIHAPVRGATMSPSWRRLVSVFQSTPLCEGRRDRDRLNRLDDVSIHAPVRGATRDAQEATRVSGFNPRPCARGDICTALMPAACSCFNPRPCARGDAHIRVDAARSVVSIHAPVRGATFARVQFNYISGVSIHAPVRGATMRPKNSADPE